MGSTTACAASESLLEQFALTVIDICLVDCAVSNHLRCCKLQVYAVVHLQPHRDALSHDRVLLNIVQRLCCVQIPHCLESLLLL